MGPGVRVVSTVGADGGVAGRGLVAQGGVPSVLWGSGLKLVQISRICAGPAAVR